MRKPGFFVPAGLLLWAVLPLCASAEVTDCREEAAKDGIVRVIEVRETYEGRAQAPETYLYEGVCYELAHADVQYEYGRRETGEQVEFTEIIALPEEDVTLIPKEKEVDGIRYVLDESSLELQAAGTVPGKGTRIVELRKACADLPDNDMKRLPLELEEDGIRYQLAAVEYTVTEETEEGIPVKYRADCLYQGLEEYTVEYEEAWQTPARYVGRKTEAFIASTHIVASYRYEEKEARTGETDERQNPAAGQTGGGSDTARLQSENRETIQIRHEEANHSLGWTAVLLGLALLLALGLLAWLHFLGKLVEFDDWEEEEKK